MGLKAESDYYITQIGVAVKIGQSPRAGPLNHARPARQRASCSQVSVLSSSYLSLLQRNANNRKHSRRSKVGRRTSRGPTKAAHPAHPSSAECGGVPRIVGRATCTQAAGPVRVKASLQPRSTWLAPGSAGAEVGRPAASSWAAFCLGRTSRLG